MATFAVQYTYTDDDAGRDKHREEHRAYLTKQDGVLLSGPFLDFPAGALIVVRADDEDAATALLDADPFHREGLIAERLVREYQPVLGSQSTGFVED
ncbi:YciI family protein [Luteipulveratus sp. YIM 133132]|uniref:YciI family protein n=1 Tax=Luteipulveratus flavus TaxID=3031728 RepID=UPI0023B08E13|nr:YciI family protein [Luteipulveratus sp. YIM 133132]MDE9364846.1 YciI family protein [Luteipulveratus sp. YIM 133132]